MSDAVAGTPRGNRAPDPAHHLVAACLCAGWCGTCETYRPLLRQLAHQHPAWQFAWIDIEDDADALGDDALDIQTFPTLLLLRAGVPLFYGPLLPQAGTLARLLAAVASHPPAPGAAASVPAAMAAAVWRLAPQRLLAP